MSTMVSARIPGELAVQVSDLLAREGKTTTEFIRAAYEQYARSRMFPQVPKEARGNVRTLTANEKERLAARFRVSSLDLVLDADVAEDKEMVAEAKVKKYEALG